MYKTILATLIIIAGFLSSPIRADVPAEFAPVIKIFSGLSYADHEMIKESTTNDFLLLEVGEVWDLEFLLSLVEPSKQQRDNYFSVISIERLNDAALINYWNRAEFPTEETSSSRAWLESVLVVKTEAGWKLKQMHSTRIEPASIPGDAKMVLQMVERP